MVRAAVPEAAVNENGDSLPREDDVRASGGGLVVDAISEAPPPEQSAQGGLGSGIPAPNSGHLLGAREGHTGSLAPGPVLTMVLWFGYITRPIRRSRPYPYGQRGDVVANSIRHPQDMVDWRRRHRVPAWKLPSGEEVS